MLYSRLTWRAISSLQLPHQHQPTNLLLHSSLLRIYGKQQILYFHHNIISLTPPRIIFLYTPKELIQITFSGAYNPKVYLMF